MLYAYASPSRSSPEGKIGLFQTVKAETEHEETGSLLASPTSVVAYSSTTSGPDDIVSTAVVHEHEPSVQAIDTKQQVMSSLSITLTALSIVVALR
jgi:hypothetical protein